MDKIKVNIVEAPDSTQPSGLEKFRMEEEQLKAEIRRNLQTNSSMKWQLIQIQLLIKKRYEEKNRLFRKYKKEGKGDSKAHLSAWDRAWKESGLEGKLNELDMKYGGLATLYLGALRDDDVHLRDILKLCPSILDPGKDRGNHFAQIRGYVTTRLEAAFEDKVSGKKFERHLGFLLKDPSKVKVPDYLVYHAYRMFHLLHRGNLKLSRQLARAEPYRYRPKSTPRGKAEQLTADLFEINEGHVRNVINRINKLSRR